MESTLLILPLHHPILHSTLYCTKISRDICIINPARTKPFVTLPLMDPCAKVLLAFDSFKDTLTSQEISSIVKSVIEGNGNASVVVKPLSDGGEGFLSSLQNSLPLEPVHVNVHGPLGDNMNSTYSTFTDPETKVKTAVIEMATAAGLEFVPESQRNPLNTTAVGVSELISHAVEQK